MSPGPVTAADLAAWRELLAVGRLQVERPRRDARDLRRAAKACRRARWPTEDEAGQRLLFGLIREAEAMEGLSPFGRQTRAPALAQQLSLAARYVPGSRDEAAGDEGASAPQPGEPGFRQDVHG